MKSDVIKMIRHGMTRFVLSVVLLSSAASAAPLDTRALADSVKNEFRHAWNGYKTYAWGHDGLRPISKTPYDMWGESLLLTPVDAFDTMLLMGLKDDAREAKQLILERLSFDKDIDVSVFEITLRCMGSLLSAYQLDGDPRFLALAKDLGDRLLPAFRTSTGIPYVSVNLRTGKPKTPVTSTAGAGTLLVEFGMLSRLTGDSVYYRAAKRALVQLYDRRSPIGLVGTSIDAETGAWKDPRSHIGGNIDSYYEYLLKCWLLFGDTECRTMWEESIRSVNTVLADSTSKGLFYRYADMNSGAPVATTSGALDAFFPAVLALGGDLRRAEQMQASCFAFWTVHDIEPERFDYTSGRILNAWYYLRPEIIESAYYLYHYTHDDRYVVMGKAMFESVVRCCRTDAAYAQLKSVVTKEQDDYMESFFYAETMKYFYLLFAPEETLPFDDVIFTTEAHPMKKAAKRRE